MTTEAYPLCWPQGWPRTPSHKRERSRFKVSPGAAVQVLVKEIDRLAGLRRSSHETRNSLIISTNMRLRKDGLPYAAQRQPDDPGVAVYFTLKGKHMVFACDRFNLLHDNQYAIAKTIEALRGIERWGASDMMERAFTGFEALPFFDELLPEKWNDVLGVGNLNTFTLDDCKRNYRLLASEYHPDKPGGDHEKMQKLNWAMDEARKYFGV